MDQILIWISVILSLSLYVPLVVWILQDKIKQSFATWVLWVALDVIALASIWIVGGNYKLLVTYCFGGTVVFISLFCKKQRSWTWFETKVLISVIICMIGWALSGPSMATILSTLAVVISAYPQFVESRKNPSKTTAIIYLGYTIANFLSFLGGKTWSIEERFYPGGCTLLCTTIMIVSLRKPSPTPLQQEVQIAPL